MDPPDGGSVSIAEQVRRMAADVEAARKQLAESRELEGRMRTMLLDVWSVNSDVPDCIDNHGQPYQSAYFAVGIAALAAEQEKNDE